ncbi:MAG TPA: hypothetical protein VJT78_13860 [Candidatus Dormibacteraeota bacterium]|nr:hypothetical protein [Candidatus Dormibacteraeota bacterium]
MKRLLAAAAISVGLLVASPVSVGAWVVFCDWDPLVLVITPSGHLVPVFDSVWTSSPLALAVPLESHRVSRVYSSTGKPETAVDMTIYVPTGLLFRYATTDLVTSGLLGSGKVYAVTNGNSGTPAHLHFVLPES